MDVVRIFPGYHAQELRVILVAVLVVRTNPDQLKNLDFARDHILVLISSVFISERKEG